MNLKWLLTFAFLTFTILSQGQFEKHLVGFYPFEKGQAKDYSKRGGGKGTIYGNLQIVKGVMGDAVRFDGGDHNIVFEGKVNRYLRGKRDFTISFYFRSDDPNQSSSLMGKRNRCDGNRMLDFRISKGKLKAELYERSRSRLRNNVNTRIRDNAWHHYVYVRRGNTIRLYVDGVLVEKSRIPHIISIDDRAYFAINASPCKGQDGTGNLRGALDELIIYKVALSENNVRQLYDISRPKPQSRYRDQQQNDPRNNQRSRTTPPRLKNPKPNSSRNNNTLTDTNPSKFFGKYVDAESNSSLILEQGQFVLTVKNPEGFQADELIYVGKYRIENDEIQLLNGEVNLKNPKGNAPQKIEYSEKISWQSQLAVSVGSWLLQTETVY